MSNFFGILLLMSIIVIILGMIKPDLALSFMDKEKRNKKMVFLVYGPFFIISFGLFIVSHI